MSFNVGESVGPYRIIEQLGQGGMATVYKAYHAALDRYVALKVLHPAFHEDQSFTARFQREARVVAKLEHAHIVPVYDYAEHEGRPYLVMKFIEGETLKSRLARSPLTSQEIARVVDSVGTALAYAHKQGILHRDIKPSNVLIATDGEMYLADFGLARIAQAGESTLSSDSIMGTPQYISPEQAMGKKDLDQGTDIYSFGVMLYEMVVGQVPFSADTPFSIIHDHIYTPLPLPMDINPNVPEPVQRVLLKVLAKDRADRYATVLDMIRAFKNAWQEAGVPMQGTSITMRPSAMKPEAKVTEQVPKATPVAGTVSAKAPQKRKRSPWKWIAGGIVALLCCGFVLIALRSGRLTLPVPPTGEITGSTVPQAVLTGTPIPPPPSGSELPPPNLPPQGASPQILAAQKVVDQNPNDPNAHLALALAYWDAGQPRAAFETLTKAADLAGLQNRKFFLRAAEEFKMRGAWIAAGGMYIRAVQTYPLNDVPEDLTVNFHEAIYKASEQTDMPLYYKFDRIETLDQPLAYVAQGRHALFTGNLDLAKAQLRKVKEIKPDLYEAFLLEAEINMKEGKPDSARPILISLSSDLGAPAWVRAMAADLLGSLP